MRDRGKTTDEQYEAEMAFGDTLRAKLEAGRPKLEDLMGRGRAQGEARRDPGEAQRDRGAHER